MKHFKRSNGLGTALYKNDLFFYYISHCKFVTPMRLFCYDVTYLFFRNKPCNKKVIMPVYIYTAYISKIGGWVLIIICYLKYLVLLENDQINATFILALIYGTLLDTSDVVFLMSLCLCKKIHVFIQVILQ